MATPKRITKELAEANKKKLQVLRLAGYNIKIDGSWGPWLELQYRKIISKREGKSNLANMGVMALPVAGYGAAQLLEGLGSVSLPSISIPSASAHAMAAPVALTLAGPAYGLYETLTGKHHQIQSTPLERQAQAYASDATRVSRPITLDFPMRANSELIGERYVNPILSREATRSRHLATADEAVNDSITPVPVDTVKPTAPSAPPPQEPKNNEDKEKDKNKDKKENSGRGFWGNLLRTLWETKDNNFGKYYIGRNILRGITYPFIAPPISGALYEHVPEAFKFYGDYAKKSFNYGRGNTAVQDSTPVNNPKAAVLSRDSSQVQLLTQHVIPQAKNGVIQAEDMSAVIDSILEI